MDVNEELKDKKYTEEFSETKLFDKIKKFAKKAGIIVIYFALLMFYTLQQSTTSMLAKSIIVGALGYFIFPLDLIPDFIPLVGFSDDLTALVSGIVAIALYVNEDSIAKAKAKLHVWFGEYDEAELDAFHNKIKN